MGLGAKGTGPADGGGAPSRQGAASVWGLPERGTGLSGSREHLGASRGPGGSVDARSREPWP